MATVNYVDAQFVGGTVRFQILPPADEIERLALCDILKPPLRSGSRLPRCCLRRSRARAGQRRITAKS